MVGVVVEENIESLEHFFEYKAESKFFNEEKIGNCTIWSYYSRKLGVSVNIAVNNEHYKRVYRIKDRKPTTPTELSTDYLEYKQLVLDYIYSRAKKPYHIIRLPK